MLNPTQAMRPRWMAATPATVVWQRRGVRLLHYTPRADGPSRRSPLLIVSSMINRYYVLDLLPGHSLVEHLVAQGHQVYLLDWGQPEPEDRFLDLDGCIVDLLGAGIDRARRHAGARRVGLLGYSVGGTLAAIHAALRPETTAFLINLCGPIDFARGGLFAAWTDRRWFSADAIVDAFGNLPAAFLQSSFSWLVPTMLARKLGTLALRAGDEGYLRLFAAVELWAADNVAFRGGAYRGYIRELYQENRLVKGELEVRGQPVRLEAIRCPVLVVVASGDEIAPPASALALRDRCGSEDVQATQVQGGHVGVMIGSQAQRSLWPTLDRWLHARPI